LRTTAPCRRARTHRSRRPRNIAVTRTFVSNNLSLSESAGPPPTATGYFIELSKTPRYFSEGDVLRVLRKEIEEIKGTDITVLTQRLEPTDHSISVIPERRWVVGFTDKMVATTCATKINNLKFGLATLQCRLVGELTFSENFLISPMIQAKNLPKKCTPEMLEEWISPVTNFAFEANDKIYGNGETRISAMGEAERSLILMTRNLTSFNSSVVNMESVEGY